MELLLLDQDTTWSILLKDFSDREWTGHFQLSQPFFTIPWFEEAGNVILKLHSTCLFVSTLPLYSNLTQLSASRDIANHKIME